MSSGFRGASAEDNDLDASRTLTPKVSLLSVSLFSCGLLINAASYQSLEPVAVAAAFYVGASAMLWFTPLGGAPERRMFSRVFAVGFTMAGIAAVYANQFSDPGQLSSDAAGFFEMAAGRAKGLTLFELQSLHEGAGAIILWGVLYDAFAAIGFERARYIGITANVTLVALTGVVGIKMVRQVFGHDPYRFRRLTLLVSGCGLFWLFAGIHVRDATILLAVTALAYVWVSFLSKPEPSRGVLKVVFWSLLAAPLLGLLRGEFFFVPVATAVAGVAAQAVGSGRRRQLVGYILVAGGSMVGLFLAMKFAADILSVLDRGRVGYEQHAAGQHQEGSLGMALVVRQPIPIRLVVGSIYLLIFPIPVWSGLQVGSAYALFKAANAAYLYFVVPLLFVTLREFLTQQLARRPALVFSVFIFTGMTAAVAASSLETRHWGAFLMPALLVAAGADLRLREQLRTYKAGLLIMLSGVSGVHVAWAILKFF